VSQDKKKKRQQNRPQNQKAAGLVNANHFYETAEELANRHLEQHKQERQQQSKRMNRQKSQNPENPQS
jgi:hypothetical protein